MFLSVIVAHSFHPQIWQSDPLSSHSRKRKINKSEADGLRASVKDSIVSSRGHMHAHTGSSAQLWAFIHQQFRFSWEGHINLNINPNTTLIFLSYPVWMDVCVRLVADSKVALLASQKNFQKRTELIIKFIILLRRNKWQKLHPVGTRLTATCLFTGTLSASAVKLEMPAWSAPSVSVFSQTYAATSKLKLYIIRYSSITATDKNRHSYKITFYD